MLSQRQGSKAGTSNYIPQIMWDVITCPCPWYVMTSSNGNIFRVTGHLCGEFTGPRWIPHTKASDAELWCFLWSVSEQTEQSWGWWFDTLSHPLWRHHNDLLLAQKSTYVCLARRDIQREVTAAVITGISTDTAGNFQTILLRYITLKHHRSYRSS